MANENIKNEQEQDLEEFEQFFEDEMDQELPDFDSDLAPVAGQEAPAAEAADAKAENARPAAWAKSANNSAYIGKDTKALAANFPQVKETADNLLNKAESLVANLQKAFPDETFKAAVKVTAMTRDVKDENGKKIPDALNPGKFKKEAVLDNDGNQAFAAKVDIVVNPDPEKKKPVIETISVNANKNGTELTSVKAKAFNGAAKKEVPVSEVTATVAKFVETRELSINLKNFAFEANQQFKETSPKTTNKEGKEVSKTYALYDEQYQKVTISSRENTAVELNVGKQNNFRYATLVEFQGKGEAPIKTPIKNANDLKTAVDAGKIAPEAADVIAAFKHNFEFVNTKTTETAKTPNQQLVYDLNEKLKETTDRVPGKDGKEVMNTYAQYNEKNDSVILRNHDQPNIVVSMKKTDEGKAIVCAFNYDMKDENDKPAMAYINTKKDVKEYLGDCPKELQDAVKEFKEMDKVKEAGIEK